MLWRILLPIARRRQRRRRLIFLYMLYVFCGDRFVAREMGREFVAVCKRKRPLAEHVYLSPPVPSRSLEELLLGQGLFERKCIVFCDEMVGDRSAQHLVDNLSLYHRSPHMFVIFEPSLSARDEKMFVSSGAVVKRCRERAVPEDVRPLFAFADVFLKGDRDKTFVSFHKLLRGGGQPSSVLNTLLWQLRVLSLVSFSDTAASAGVKPFVFNKAGKVLSSVSDPFLLFVRSEEIVRSGRLHGLGDEDIVEHLILSL